MASTRPDPDPISAVTPAHPATTPPARHAEMRDYSERVTAAEDRVDADSYARARRFNPSMQPGRR
jgi:hypothetical protein